MMVASEADDAWWPPTLRPSVMSRMWLALWIIQLASHSTLRSSALNDFRSFAWVAMAVFRALIRHPEVRAAISAITCVFAALWPRASKDDGSIIARPSFEGFAARSHLRMTGQVCAF